MCRNTSTYVEKTLHFHEDHQPKQKHLHVCGENQNSTPQQRSDKETPPRMWRKPPGQSANRSQIVNTSTYVEKTSLCTPKPECSQKHLHVCGENFFHSIAPLERCETPPRMWRKHGASIICSLGDGNTSTYVEKTDIVEDTDFFYEKHLHVCGENSCNMWVSGARKETPPRMWRKRLNPSLRLA